jgi:glucose-6-phosphate 1-epimerase
MIAELNERYGVEGRVWAGAGPSGLPHLFMQAGGAQAEVALQGGHVVRYGHVGAPPILWCSSQAIFAAGKAIRGGIPICWPWFGPHPDDPAKPAHGFVRTAMWAIRATGADESTAWARIGLSDDDATRAIWPHAFDLELTVSVGAQLEVALSMRNRGDRPFTCGGALHSYLTVGDIAQIAIEGLAGTAYLDKVGGGERVQEGSVQFSGEVDRVYLATTADCGVVDPVLGRRIVIAKTGSQTTVVWNPWVEKARRLTDMADDEYREMVCVETTNAANDLIALGPGAAHNLRATIGAVAI